LQRTLQYRASGVKHNLVEDVETWPGLTAS
jgi:hypothetical protein